MKDIFSNIEQQIENIDAKIEGIVKNATDSKSYEKLNERINDMVNCSTTVFEKGYARAEEVVKAQTEKFKSASELQRENLKGSTELKTVKQNVQAKQELKKSEPARQDLFAKKDGGGGLALSIVGFVFTAIFGVGILSMLFLSAILLPGFWQIINRVLLVPGFIIFLIMGIIGIVMMARANRYKKYIQVLDGGMHADVSDFARAVSKSAGFVRNDLKRMISKNWFKQGYLTHDQETLIVCNDAYEEYRVNKQRTLEAQTYQEQIRQMHEQLPAHARKTIQIGEDLIKEIHEKKVAISDYDMTIKLSHLETILKKIFKRVEKHPEVVPQMRKMMDYYLPTTIKLLDAYVQLDKQAVAGANIMSAKEEIEESLDTLITAYEKLLDDLFEDIMLDVSTDISVLNTMLAQDGLTNTSDFGSMKEAMIRDTSNGVGSIEETIANEIPDGNFENIEEMVERGVQ